MSTESTFRLALVGCGRISKNHFDAIEKVDGLDLVAVCDSDGIRAQRAGEERGVPYFTSLKKMLSFTHATKPECSYSSSSRTG